MAIRVAELRRILTFHSFQTSSETRIIKEPIAFRLEPPPFTTLCNQALTESSFRQAIGEESWIPSQVQISFQIQIVNLHWNRRLVADSWTCLQRGQSMQFDHPPSM